MLRGLISFWVFLALSLTASGQDSARAPEAATGVYAKGLSTAQKHMIAAANPIAAEAGRDMLRAGGSAVDAAIATQLVLGLVEPQSSGLGGGAFIMHWHQATKTVTTYDGRETAPAAAKPDRFLRDGQPMAFDAAVASGLSVGVPGVMRALELAHQQHGKLAWAKLFEPAIALAEKGFPVPARLSALLAANGPASFAPAARGYFFDSAGVARPTGYVLQNPAYAQTLHVLAEKGAGALYEGAIADEIVAAVANAPTLAGDLTAADLATYRAKERAAVCFNYRVHKICGMGPPSSGALTIAQTLKLIEPFAAVQGARARLATPALHIIAEAEKLAYADRNRYIADPDFVSIPGGLLDDGYLAERRKLIDLAHAMAKPAAGLPPGLAHKSMGLDATREAAGTSHLSIVDDDGNAMSMTSTVESAFGAHLWAAGFLLNNQMTDFSFRPVDQNGLKIANAVEAGKRPRSSMAPTLVFDVAGDLEAVTGSPGGSRIILFVVKALVAMLDWGLDPQGAAALVNFGSEGGPMLFDYKFEALWPALSLKSYGHAIAFEDMTSGVHTILRRGRFLEGGHLEGGADPRREGVALGD